MGRLAAPISAHNIQAGKFAPAILIMGSQEVRASAGIQLMKANRGGVIRAKRLITRQNFGPAD